MQVLERYKSQNLQRVCNFEVNKAQIKNGIRFWCSFYLILLKTSNHQNKTNRVCIKHWNLQCFLSMSFNVFNATLGSDTFPPSRGRPWGGGGYHIYIYFFFIYISYIYIYIFQVENLRTKRRDAWGHILWASTRPRRSPHSPCRSAPAFRSACLHNALARTLRISPQIITYHHISARLKKWINESWDESIKNTSWGILDRILDTYSISSWCWAQKKIEQKKQKSHWNCKAVAHAIYRFQANILCSVVLSVFTKTLRCSRNVVLQELVSPVGSLKQWNVKRSILNDGKKRIKCHKIWQNVCSKWWNVGAVGSWLAWQVGIVQFKGVEGSTFPACLKSRKLSQRAQKTQLWHFDTSTVRVIFVWLCM